ncbi:MAG: HlyD family secretion protein [Methylobacteriaceae bacterium]|nr:HlyD family secretion protein [Methylobacteriaceae bacterium]
MASLCRGSQGRRYARSAALAATMVSTLAPATAADPQPNPAGMAVSVTKARRICFSDTLQLTGRLVAREELPVRPDAEGLRVTQVLVEDGDKVTAGQVLARLGRTEGLPGPTTPIQLTAPAAGIVLSQAPPSPRAVRPEPMFRIIVNGEIEADIEVPALILPRISAGQAAELDIAGIGPLPARVRTISPEVDPATQLGHVRISFKTDSALHVGSFAKATIVRGRNCGPAVPLSAVLYGAEGAVVQIVRSGRIQTQPVRVGLLEGEDAEVPEGLAVGDVVVKRAGTFLREGDIVRQVSDDAS